MKAFIYIVFCLIFFLAPLIKGKAQSVSISTDNSTPDANAILDVKSTTKGVLVPRMTSAQRVAIMPSANGLLVYDLTTNSFWFYNGGEWEELIGGYVSELRDADNDTKIQVEESPDEDIIRFDIGGSEKMVLRKNASGVACLEFDGSTTFLGNSAGIANTTGIYNTATGQNALRFNSTGNENTANGVSALYFNTSGGSNIAFGAGSLYNNTTGSNNTSIGKDALFSNKANSRSTAVGKEAMVNADDRVIGRETFNTAVGYQSLRGSNTPVNNTGRFNTAIGDQALYSNTSGSINTACGSTALLLNTTGNNNTAIGEGALRYNTIGIYNTASGANSLFGNSSGNKNTSTGKDAMFYNSSGHNNTANGYLALHENMAGSDNTAIGMLALFTTLNSANTAIGAVAGADSENSNNCTYIGYNADNDYIENSYTNSTALGNGSRMTASDQIRIGNSSIGSIGGFEPWTDISDGRLKKDIQENVPGLTFISKLRPVTYHLDVHGLAEKLNEDGIDDRIGGEQHGPSAATIIARDEKELVLKTGFIAQEVEAAAQELGYEFSGIDAPKNETDLYGLRYSQFVVPLVKAVQEQQAMIEELRREIEELKKKG